MTAYKNVPGRSFSYYYGRTDRHIIYTSGGQFTNVDRTCDVANRLRSTSHVRYDLFTKRVALNG